MKKSMRTSMTMQRRFFCTTLGVVTALISCKARQNLSDPKIISDRLQESRLVIQGEIELPTEINLYYLAHAYDLKRYQLDYAPDNQQRIDAENAFKSWSKFLESFEPRYATKIPRVENDKVDTSRLSYWIERQIKYSLRSTKKLTMTLKALRQGLNEGDYTYDKDKRTIKVRYVAEVVSAVELIGPDRGSVKNVTLKTGDTIKLPLDPTSIYFLTATPKIKGSLTDHLKLITGENIAAISRDIDQKQTIIETRFDPPPGACFGPEGDSVIPFNYFYYFDPSRSGCEPQGQVIQAKVIESTSGDSSVSKYPEYHRLFADKVFDTFYFLGSVSNEAYDEAQRLAKKYTAQGYQLERFEKSVFATSNFSDPGYPDPNGSQFPRLTPQSNSPPSGIIPGRRPADGVYLTGPDAPQDQPPKSPKDSAGPAVAPPRQNGKYQPSKVITLEDLRRDIEQRNGAGGYLLTKVIGGITFEIVMVLEQMSRDTARRDLHEALRKFDYIYYGGHAGYGANVEQKMTDAETFKDERYQILFVDGCQTFYWGMVHVMAAKSIPGFDFNFLNSDFIVTADYVSGWETKDVVHERVAEAAALYPTDEPGKVVGWDEETRQKFSWQKIVKDLNDRAEEYKRKPAYLIAAAEQNVFDPNLPGNQEHPKPTFSLAQVLENNNLPAEMRTQVFTRQLVPKLAGQKNIENLLAVAKKDCLEIGLNPVIKDFFHPNCVLKKFDLSLLGVERISYRGTALSAISATFHENGLLARAGLYGYTKQKFVDGKDRLVQGNVTWDTQGRVLSGTIKNPEQFSINALDKARTIEYTHIELSPTGRLIKALTSNQYKGISITLPNGQKISAVGVIYYPETGKIRAVSSQQDESYEGVNIYRTNWAVFAPDGRMVATDEEFWKILGGFNTDVYGRREL